MEQVPVDHALVSAWLGGGIADESG